MSNGLIKMLLVVSCLLLVVGLTGCAERTESTSYYYSPGWTQGGNIIFSLGLQTVRKDVIGTELGSSYNESVSTMSPTGANETFLFDSTASPAYAKSCSPNSDYLGYLDNLRNDIFGKLVIRNISSGTHRGLEKAEMLFSPGILSFDWSKNGTRIVYCTTGEVRIRDWDDYTGATDTLVTAEADLSFVSWQNGDRIAFVRSTAAGKLLSLIYLDGTGRVDLPAAASVDKPQVSFADTNEVYGIAGTDYCVVNVNAATRTARFANFKGDLPRLSPDAKKVVYDKTGERSGIYLLDTTSWTESGIK